MTCGSRRSGLTGYFEDQVGRCPTCMKQAFGAAAVGWILWLGMAAMGQAHALPGYLLLLLSLALTGLWAFHVWRFTRDRLEEARHLYEFRRDPFSARAGRQIASTSIKAGIAVSLPRFLAGGGAQNPWCDCYFDEDCGFLMFCKWGVDCNNQRKGGEQGGVKCPDNEKAGSCDGLCRFLRLAPALELAQVAQYMRTQFEPFLQAARREDWHGMPGAAEWSSAQGSIPEDCRDDLRGIVFSALDVVVGWDMVFTDVDSGDHRKSYRDAFLGHVTDHQATPLIIEAARDALCAAVEHGDLSRVDAPLAQFWESYPGYAPRHSGRCYPHGHSVFETAIECQAAQLKSMARVIIETQRNIAADQV